jgi:hypothetical protein
MAGFARKAPPKPQTAMYPMMQYLKKYKTILAKVDI